MNYEVIRLKTHKPIRIGQILTWFRNGEEVFLPTATKAGSRWLNDDYCAWELYLTDNDEVNVNDFFYVKPYEHTPDMIYPDYSNKILRADDIQDGFISSTIHDDGIGVLLFKQSEIKRIIGTTENDITKFNVPLIPQKVVDDFVNIDGKYDFLKVYDHHSKVYIDFINKKELNTWWCELPDHMKNEYSSTYYNKGWKVLTSDEIEYIYTDIYKKIILENTGNRE